MKYRMQKNDGCGTCEAGCSRGRKMVVHGKEALVT